jgi:hypothetical protein
MHGGGANGIASRLLGAQGSEVRRALRQELGVELKLSEPAVRLYKQISRTAVTSIAVVLARSFRYYPRFSGLDDEPDGSL